MNVRFSSILVSRSSLSIYRNTFQTIAFLKFLKPAFTSRKRFPRLVITGIPGRGLSTSLSSPWPSSDSLAAKVSYNSLALFVIVLVFKGILFFRQSAIYRAKAASMRTIVLLRDITNLFAVVLTVVAAVFLVLTSSFLM